MALRTNVAAGDPNLAGILNEERVAINALQYNSGVRRVTSLLPSGTFVANQGGLFVARTGDTVTWVFHDLVGALNGNGGTIAIPPGFRTWVGYPPPVFSLPVGRGAGTINSAAMQIRIDTLTVSVTNDTWAMYDVQSGANYRCTISVPALDPGIPPTSLPGIAA